MKARLSVIVMLAAAAVALAADSSSVVADKHLKLLLAKNYDEAAKMLKPGGGATPQNLAKLASLKLSPVEGATKIELGAVMFSMDTERQSLIVYERRTTFAPDRVAKMKAETNASFAEDFPPAQIPAAKRVLRWQGAVWVDFLAVYMEREIKHRDVVVNGIVTESVRKEGPWMVNMKGEDFPLKEFRPNIMKKFGANILRWGGEDLGDAGCVDAKEASGRCYAGEASPQPAGGPKCYLVSSGKPCPENISCFSVKDFDPVPCRRGQRGCSTNDGDKCVVK